MHERGGDVIHPVMVGTAGHIDHGKSTLVRTLTGIDPDRLEEEKRTGMTIDLGFAPLRMADGRVLGEFGERGVDSATALISLHRLVGSKRRVGALGRSLLRRFALRPAQSVETQIHRHPVKPRFNPRALRAPFRRVLPKPQKRFLRDVFRRRAVSQHAIAGGKNSVRMPNDKLARCKTVAPSRPLDKRFVRIV